MYRLFVAIDLPEDVKNHLSLMSYGMPGARWVDDDQVHLTLHFIGEVDGGVFEDLREALGEIKCATFTITLSGTGHFPPRGKPTILWATIFGISLCLILRVSFASRNSVVVLIESIVSVSYNSTIIFILKT